MQVRTHDSADEFRALAGPVYRRDPIGFTVELAGLAAPALPADAVLLTAWDAGRVVGAAVQTPPYPLACGGLPDRAVAPAVAALTEQTPRLTAVRGPLETATRFAAAWTQRTGAAIAERTEERLHALGRLEAPTVAGEHRTDRPSDTDLLADWSGRFFVEAFGVAPRPIADHRAFVTTQTRAGSRFVLWLRDDRPVSMAMLRPTVAGVARIGPVYTPDADRGHGYGSAVTAAAASLALAGGAGDVVLFTDLANPVSNAIYRRIGFRPVGDWLAVEFTTRR